MSIEGMKARARKIGISMSHLYKTARISQSAVGYWNRGGKPRKCNARLLEMVLRDYERIWLKYQPKEKDNGTTKES